MSGLTGVNTKTCASVETNLQLLQESFNLFLNYIFQFLIVDDILEDKTELINRNLLKDYNIYSTGNFIIFPGVSM